MNFEVGDVLLDKIVPTSRLLVLEKNDVSLKCIFLDGKMKDTVINLTKFGTYKKVGEICYEALGSK